MGAAIGEPDCTGRTLLVGGLGRILQPVGALTQLFGLYRQQVATGVDADVVELGRLATQLLRHLHVALVAPLFRGVEFIDGRTRLRIGECKDGRLVWTQKQRAVGGSVEKGAVVAGDQHRHVARKRVQPGFEPGDLGEVEMVGRLVEEQRVGIRDPDAGKERQPLPAAAQVRDGALTKGLGHLERIQHDIDAPAFAVRLLARQVPKEPPAWNDNGSSCAGTFCSTWPMVRPRERVISPAVGSKLPPIDRSRVDLPRPLAATMPRRSPAAIERLRLENSDVLRVTPRLRILIKAMFVRSLDCASDGKHPRAANTSAGLGGVSDPMHDSCSVRAASARYGKRRGRSNRNGFQPHHTGADQEIRFARTRSDCTGQPCKRICRALTGPRWRWCRKKVITTQPSFHNRVARSVYHRREQFSTG